MGMEELFSCHFTAIRHDDKEQHFCKVSDENFSYC